ncbi:MAG: sigma-70 family RNA polymerase sigma factor [Acidobacteriota bacterium]|nr:sigma-70 family RNA polymerase sigma factor [Acidobacteriota bacterium]
MTALAAEAVRHDRELVARHAYGDPEAFDEVYARFSGLVFQIARRMSGDDALAEDLSQEIFLRIFRHLRGYQGRSSLKTWVYRVAINCCRSRLARRSRRERAFVAVEEGRLERVPSAAEGPQGRLRRREAAETVGRALNRLPLAFREAVVLRDVCGLSYEEIATVAGVRLGTVRSRIARGRDRLRLELERGSS